MTRRRTFLALLGAATAVSADVAGAATDESSQEQEQESDSSDRDPVDVEALEPAEALLAYVVSRYGDRLDEDDREVIRDGIEGSLASGAAFREVGLENEDEPAYQFSAYRCRGRNRDRSRGRGDPS